MKLKVIQADITTMNVDAIVNAANSSLLGGSGVDGAIHRKGGLEILKECRQIVARQGTCKVGEAVITTAGNLPAKYIIHTVGPVWNQGGKDKEQLLANCYTNSLFLAQEYEIESIAFPNISTGIYRFPKKLAATIAIEAVSGFKKPETLKEITFVCFEPENYEVYRKLVKS